MNPTDKAALKLKVRQLEFENRLLRERNNVLMRALADRDPMHSAIRDHATKAGAA